MNVGQIIAERFEVGEFIRQGGMGAVYRGLDRHNGQAVAIKLLKAGALTDDPANVERFAREGEALRTLNHPNIVKMLAMVEENDQRYLIMEYVSGGSLADLLGAQPELPIQRVLEIGLDLADALTRTHRLDIIHRDLKPANVLIAEDGTPRLTDFGVARIGDSDMTDSGQILGTYSYLSPEALNGLPLDARADIWAFGVLLFEMLAGHKPFTADSLGALMTAILSKPVPDLEALRPDAPIALIDLIYRMLEKEREQRIGSVRLVGAEIEALLRGETTPVSRSAKQPVAGRIDGPTLFTTTTPSEGEHTPHNLPAQATEFVGREAELAELAKLLDGSRLVTVLGPGGMGKTRLALEAATTQIEKFAEGVYVVSLAPLSTPETIVPTIAEAVRFSFFGGAEPKQQLLDFLRARRMLLLLDNFEHLLAGVGLVSEILQAAPGVKILATSRERLNVEGETIFRLEGMDFPDWETPEGAAEYSAVKLFLQSARRVQPDFALDLETLNYVARICQLVQGMPLGILLAAAWVEALTVSEIAVEIEQSLGFLETEQRDIPARHRSLRAAFDYSWNLLADTERDVFKKLSVFRGGFTREAAQQVAGASLKNLMTLVNKSLLRRDASTGRYDIHELLRQYGDEQLKRSAEDAEAVYERHGTFYAEYMQQQWTPLRSAKQKAALDAIELELDNVRSAWHYLVEAHKTAEIRKIARRLGYFIDLRNYYQEGVNLFGRATEATQPTLPRQAPEALYGNLLAWQAWFYMAVGLVDKAQALSDESLVFLEHWDSLEDRLVALVASVLISAIAGDMLTMERSCRAYLKLARERGDDWEIGCALYWQGCLLVAQEAFVEAKHIGEEALYLFERFGDRWQIGGVSLFLLARTALHFKEYSEAARHCEQALALFKEVNNLWGIAESYSMLARIVTFLGEYSQATDYYQQNLRLFQENGQTWQMLQTLSVVAEMRLAQGQQEQAVEFLALACYHALSVAGTRKDAKVRLDELQALLPAEAFSAAVERGKVLDLDTVVAEFLAE